MTQLFDKKESWGRERELLTDIKVSLTQLARGQRIKHQDAKNIILKKYINPIKSVKKWLVNRNGFIERT